MVQLPPGLFQGGNIVKDALKQGKTAVFPDLPRLDMDPDHMPCLLYTSQDIGHHAAVLAVRRIETDQRMVALGHRHGDGAAAPDVFLFRRAEPDIDGPLGLKMGRVLLRAEIRVGVGDLFQRPVQPVQNLLIARARHDIIGLRLKRGHDTELRRVLKPVAQQQVDLAVFQIDVYKRQVFGQVYSGMDVVEKIAGVDVEGENDKPKKDVVINSVTISTYDEAAASSAAG